MSASLGASNDSVVDAVALVVRPAITGPHGIELPAGSNVDPGVLFDVSTVSNRAHAALGTELVEIGAGHGAIRLRFRPELGEADASWAPGVVASLADHVCAFTSVVALGDVAYFGGTMSLRVEYARPTASEWLVAHAVARPGDDHVLRLAAEIHAVGIGGAAGTSARVAGVRCSVLDRRLAA